MRGNERIWILGMGLLVGAALAVQVRAEAPACADHATVVDRLAAGYGELLRSVALSADNVLVEVFASAETGTWTMTMTRPGGPTCLVASGHAWEEVAAEAPRPGEGA